MPINYATWNPDDKSPSITLSNGNLTAENTGGGTRSFRSTVSVTAGKWYWEVTLQEEEHAVGIATAAASLSGAMYENVYGWGLVSHQAGEFGELLYNESSPNYGPEFLSAVVGIALNMDAGTLFFSLDNVWLESSNPETGANPAFSGISGTIFAANTIFSLAGEAETTNFGATPFAGTVPSGFNSGLYAITGASRRGAVLFL